MKQDACGFLPCKMLIMVSAMVGSLICSLLQMMRQFPSASGLAGSLARFAHCECPCPRCGKLPHHLQVVFL